MWATRRHASIGLALSAIIPFQVRAQSVGFGVLVDAIGETITQTANVIGAVTEQLNKAVSNGIGIYDKFKLEDLKGKLVSLEGQMSDLNGMKGTEINDFNFYINKTPVFKPTWQEIQNQCKKISSRLDTLLEQLGSDDTVLVQGTSLATAGDLKAILNTQSSIYKQLSTLEEPKTDEDLQKLKPVATALDDLRTKVVALEIGIDAYLKKFSPTP
jgi:hypothetical protein